MARPRKGQELGATHMIGVRVSAQLRADIEAVAKAHGRTITEESRVALERHVATANVRKAGKKR